SGMAALTTLLGLAPTHAAGERGGWDTVARNHRFTVFARLMRDSGLEQRLVRGGREFTFFAPTDEAFKRLPPGVRGPLLDRRDRGIQEAFVRAHTVVGRWDRARMKRQPGTAVSTLVARNTPQASGGGGGGGGPGGGGGQGGPGGGGADGQEPGQPGAPGG